LQLVCPIGSRLLAPAGSRENQETGKKQQEDFHDYFSEVSKVGQNLQQYQANAGDVGHFSVLSRTNKWLSFVPENKPSKK
jgi:hypothetical protein